MGNDPGRSRSRGTSGAYASSLGGDAPCAGRSSVRARATLIVGELRGFSTIAKRLEPETAVAVLQEFYGALADVSVAHAAAIERVVGDVFVVVVDATGPRRDDSVRGVRAALDLQRAFLALRNRWQREETLRGGCLGLALGVATGPLVLAELEGVPGVHTVPFGEPLSRANRLCQGARVADILIDEMTYATSRRALERDVSFTSCEVTARSREIVPAYRAQMQRAGLRVVSKHAEQDPVCGNELHPRAATPRQIYGESTFFFCSEECASRFADDPESWLPGLPRRRRR